MALTSTEKKLANIAGYLGLIQAVVWSILSTLCIVFYFIDPSFDTVSFNEASFSQLYNRILYYKYLNTDTNKWDFGNTVLTDDIFVGFMWVYLILNILWAIISMVEICGVNNSNSKFLPTTLRLWSFSTYIISLLDLIFVITLGIDKQFCTRLSNNNNNKFTDADCTSIILPVLVIAAKGFTLWIINVIFGYIIFRMGTVEKNRSIESISSIPRAQMQPQQLPTHLQQIDYYKNKNQYSYYPPSPSVHDDGLFFPRNQSPLDDRNRMSPRNQDINRPTQ